MKAYYKLLIAASLLSFPTQANSQVAPIIAADQFVDNLSQEIEERVDQVFDSSSILAFDVRTQAIVTAENLAFLSEQLVGKTINDLNVQQRKVINDAQRLIDSLDSDIDDSLKVLNDITLSMNDAFGTLPFSKTFPRINTYSPNSAIIGSTRDIRVTVNGSWIGYGSPSLVFGETKCKRQSKTERKIDFLCPKSLITSSAENDLVGNLKVFGKKKNLFSSRKTRDYEILMRPIPNTPASVVMSWVVNGDVEERRSLTKGFGHRNDHCKGARNFCWQVNADRANNWSIDVSSVKARATTKSSNSSYGGIEKLTSSGYCIKAVVRNNGTCGPKIPFTNDRVYYDGRGSVNVSTSYDEFRTIEGTKTTLEDPVNAAWGSDLSFNIPENYKGFSVKVKQYDGRDKVASKALKDDMFSVDVDEDARVIVLRFLTPDQYLNASIR